MGKGKAGCAEQPMMALLDPEEIRAGVAAAKLEGFEAQFAEEDRYISKTYFTRHEVAVLNKYMKGARTEEIAESLKITKERVEGCVGRLNSLRDEAHQQIMNNLPYDAPDWLAQAADMYLLEGRSLSDIASQLQSSREGKGPSKSTVRRWLKRAAVPRRAPAGFRPRHYQIWGNKDSGISKEIARQEGLVKQLRKLGDEGNARSAEDYRDLLSARREHTSYTNEGPFSDETVLNSLSSHFHRIQKASGGPVAMFDWEAVCAAGYDLHYDSAYVMENINNPGRDIEVNDKGRVFGISNKSEFNQCVSPDNTSFGISYFMTLNAGDSFKEKVDHHLSDYEEILNLRTFMSIYPGSDDPARCYRVYSVPRGVIAEVAEKCPKPKRGTTSVTLDSGHEVRFRRAPNGEVSFTSIPMDLAEYRAAFWLPPESARGNEN